MGTKARIGTATVAVMTRFKKLVLRGLVNRV